MRMNSFDSSRKKESVIFHHHETGEPVIIEDFATFTLGYASQEVRPGEKMYMRYSDIEEMIKRVAPEFGFVKKKKWF